MATAADEPRIEVTEDGPGKFSLAVTFEGQRFECGNYLTRPAALQAGRLFAERKKGEQQGQKKRPRKQR
ncbi:MAG TPA: hypothetical protein VM661_02220 [Candidatus Sulfotelmatobacter sp.]|jgi:hypothetical protein|nr:hypothetical protein [Candidatus Sulfotelmatobacter sp.]